MKENDWFLTELDNVNGNYTNTDYKSIGISSDNSELLSKDSYKKLDEVKNNKIFFTDGKFDDQKFDSFYNKTLVDYNSLSKDTASSDAMKSAVFFRDDIFAPIEQKEKGPNFSFIKVNNPDQTTFGISSIGRWSNPTKTPMEIAESQSIYDPNTGQFTKDTPENSFFKNFFNTVVMASWDSDGEHKDPDTGDIVKHHKGELKINPDTGTYYTEYLNGRETTGKQIIKKTDILTPEASLINKFDFFDSDGFSKSVTGTILKNAIMVAPMLIGGPVADVYVGASLGLQLLNLGTVVDKMLTGSDNKTANNIEGFIDSLSGGVSQDSQQSSWTAENLINMAGHTFKFLYEMRFISDKIPKLIKGKGITPEDQASMLKATRADIMKGQIESDGFYLGMQTNADIAAQGMVNKYVTNYQKLGQLMSRGFMAASFGSDTYNQAKAAGASDIEASVMTLASVGMQYGLLSTHIGNWIFPESKIEGLTAEKSAELMAFSKTTKEQLAKTGLSDSEAKVQWFKKFLKKSKDVIQSNYNPTKSKLKAATAMMASAGIEMSSFEALHDVSGTLFNFALELGGKKIAKDPNDIKKGEVTGFHPWENMFDRYATSFIGGAMGGLGIQPWIPMKQIGNISNMGIEDAHRYLIHLIKEGKEDTFIKTVNKMNIASKDLSFKWNESAKAFEAAKSETDSQDYVAKQSILKIIDTYKAALRDNGGIISDEKLRKALISADLGLGDLRFTALLNSRRGIFYNKQLQEIDERIVKAQAFIKESTSTEGKEQNNIKDNDKSGQEDLAKQIKDANKEIAEAVKEKQKLMEGDTPFLQEAIYDMNISLNEPFKLINVMSWCKDNDITLDTFNNSPTIQKKYSDTLDANYLEDFQRSYSAFRNVGEQSAEMIMEASKITSANFNDIYAGEKEAAINSGIQEAQDIFTSNPAYRTLVGLVKGYFTKENKTTEQDILNWKSLDIEGKKNIINKIVLNISSMPLEKVQQVKEKWLEKLNDKNSDSKLQASLYNTLVHEVYNKHREDIYNKVIESTKFNDYISSDFAEIENGFLDSLSYEQQEALQENLEQHNNTIESIFAKFVNTISQGQVNYSDLYSKIINKDNWSEINSDILNQLDITLQAAQMFSSVISAADTGAIGITNPYGFNLICNKVEKTNLPELDHEVATSLQNDFGFVANRLQYYRNMIIRAAAQKSVEQKLTGVAYKISTFKAHKQLSDKLKNIEGLQDQAVAIENALSECKVLNSRALSLTPEESKEAMQEYVRVGNVIYEQLNKLSSKNWTDLFLQYNLWDKTETLANKSMSDKALDFHSYLGTLIKLTCIKASDFYSTFKKVIIPGMAPLAPQAESIYLATAAWANQKACNKIIDAYNTALMDDSFKNAFAGEKGVSRKEWEYDAKQSDMYLRFRNIVYIGGDPGSGKTKAVMKMVKTLGESNESALKKVAIINTTEQSAKTLAKDLELPEDNCFTHKSFIENIIKDYIMKDSVEKDQIKLEDGFIRLTNDIVDTTNPYTLIMVDEATKLSDLEWQAIDDYAEKYGAFVLAAGDPMQIGRNFNYEVDAFGKSEDFHSDLEVNNFMHSTKLGLSMRTTNTYNSRGQLEYKELIQNPDKKSIDVDFYSSEKVGLQGIASIDPEGNQLKEVLDNIVKKLDADNADKKEEDKEKIQYIYTNTATPLYDLLDKGYRDKVIFIQGNDQGNEGRFYIYENPVSKLNSERVKQNYRRDVYTAITRASEGTILCINSHADPDKIILSNRSSKPPIIEDSKENKRIWEDYSKAVQSSLEGVTGEDIKFLSRDKENIVTLEQSGVPETEEPGKLIRAEIAELPEGVLVPVKDDTTPEGANAPVDPNDLLNGDGVKQPNDVNATIITNTPTIPKPPKPSKPRSLPKERLQGLIAADTTKGKHFDLAEIVEDYVVPIFTNAAHEDGMVNNGDGTYKLGKYNDCRVDGANGLFKLKDKIPYLLNKLGIHHNIDPNNISREDAEKIQAFISKLAFISLNKSNAEINEFISDTLTPGLQARFEYEFIPDWESDSMKGRAEEYYKDESKRKYLVSYRGNGEKQYVLTETSGKDAYKTARHALYIAIFDKDGNRILSTPISRIPNPYSFSQVFYIVENGVKKCIAPPEFDAIMQKIEYAAYNEGQQSVVNLENSELLPYLKDPKNSFEGFTTFAKLITLFRYSSNSAVIFGKDWNFAERFNSLGPLASFENKGDFYLGNNNYVYTVAPSELAKEYSKQDRSVSSILVLSSKLNESGIKKGLPFVLIGPKNIAPENLLGEYQDQVKNGTRKTISVRYLVRPTENISYYLRYLNSKIQKASIANMHPLGNDLTAFKIFQALQSSKAGQAWLADKFAKTGKYKVGKLETENPIIKLLLSKEQFDKIMTTLENLKTESGEPNIVEQIKFLRSESNIEKIGEVEEGSEAYYTNATLLQGFLRDLVYLVPSKGSFNNFTHTKDIEKALDELQSIAGNIEIYYSVALKKGDAMVRESELGPSFVNADGQVRNFLLPNKTDSAAYTGNINEIFDAIFGELRTSTLTNGLPYSTYDAQYHNSNLRVGSKPEAAVSTPVKYTGDVAFKSRVEELFKAPNATIESVVESLREEGVLSLSENQEIFVFGKFPGYEDYKIMKVELNKDSVSKSNEINVTLQKVLGEEKVFQGRISRDSENVRIELKEKLEDSPTTYFISRFQDGEVQEMLKYLNNEDTQTKDDANRLLTTLGVTDIIMGEDSKKRAKEEILKRISPKEYLVPEGFANDYLEIRENTDLAEDVRNIVNSGQKSNSKSLNDILQNSSDFDSFLDRVLFTMVKDRNNAETLIKNIERFFGKKMVKLEALDKLLEQLKESAKKLTNLKEDCNPSIIF